MSGAALKSAARGASYNALLQVAFRLLTFVVNAVILRQTSGEMLGVVNVRLTLLYSTVLFLAREPFRKACVGVRHGLDQRREWAMFINLVWLSVPAGIILSMITAYIWTRFLDPPSMPEYNYAVYLFALSTVLELACEPLWVLAETQFFVKLKVVVTGCALASRCLVTVVLLYMMPGLGLYAFCLAQLTQSVVFLAGYYGYFIYAIQKGYPLPLSSIMDAFPRTIDGHSWLLSTSAAEQELCWSFFKQSVLKQFLTEGERYLMTFLNVLDFTEQGVYDVITNLGSLVARFLFQPIEESYYTFFSGLVTRGTPSSQKIDKRTKEYKNELLASATLQTLMTGVFLIGLIFVVFGQAYSYLLLDIYGGAILSGGVGPQLLRAYCVYIIFLALNGVTECFAAAVMNRSELSNHTWWMVVFSLLFVGVSWASTQYFDSLGFIIANSVNMVVRILKSWYTIAHYYRQRPYLTEGNPLNRMWPSLPVLACFMAAYGVTLYSEALFCCSAGFQWIAMHVAIGGFSLAVVLTSVYLTDKPFLVRVQQLWRGKERTD